MTTPGITFPPDPGKPQIRVRTETIARCPHCDGPLALIQEFGPIAVKEPRPTKGD